MAFTNIPTTGRSQSIGPPGIWAAHIFVKNSGSVSAYRNKASFHWNGSRPSNITQPNHESLWWNNHDSPFCAVIYNHLLVSFNGGVTWCICPDFSGLRDWHWSNCMAAPVQVKESWMIWVNRDNQPQKQDEMCKMWVFLLPNVGLCYTTYVDDKITPSLARIMITNNRAVAIDFISRRFYEHHLSYLFDTSISVFVKHTLSQWSLVAYIL